MESPGPSPTRSGQRPAYPVTLVTAFSVPKGQTTDGMWYIQSVVRRMFIFAMALSLAGSLPLPLVACIPAFSRSAPSATPENQSDCDHMNMNEQRTELTSSSSSSCCITSNASLPDAVIQSHYSTAPAAPLVAVRLRHTTITIGRTTLIGLVQYLSPPPFQSVLCTFLI